MPAPTDFCSHGKMYRDTCYECAVVWWADSYEFHQKAMLKAETELFSAKAKLKLQQEHDNGKPTPGN